MNGIRPNRDNTFAVVVTYYPKPDLVKNLVIIGSQVDYVAVVDNGSDIGLEDLISKIANGRYILIANGQNLGIAAALNIGISWGVAKGYNWVLTMDQDSECLDGIIDGIGSVYDCFDDTKHLAIIGANFLHKVTGDLGYAFPEDEPCCWREEKYIFTSGSLLSLEAFQRVGPFMEMLFIDLVDHEYEMRLYRYDWKMIVTRQPFFRHVVGEPTSHKIFYKTLWASNHPPIRRFYYTRNAIILARIYYSRETEMIKTFLYQVFVNCILIILFEANKLKKLAAITKGIIVGLHTDVNPYKREVDKEF